MPLATNNKNATTPVRAISAAELSILHPKALAIACSTGGPEALSAIMKILHGTKLRVPVAITQHININFLAGFCKQIENTSGIPTYLAEEDMPVQNGCIYIANAGKHMTFARIDNDVVIKLDDGPPEAHCKPSANPMMRSMAGIYGRGLLCVVLTGMGKDASQAAQIVQAQGGTIVIQNRETSSIWGMPGAVHDAGLANATLALDEIAQLIKRVCI
jgi:two-component system chemotaxis response regulator CheB